MNAVSTPPSDALLRKVLEEKLLAVEGWLYLDEAWELLQCARLSGRGDHPLTVVEIGSFKGRSTVALALGVRDQGSGTVYSIDPHIGETESHVRQYGAQDTFEVFLANIRAAGVGETVQPMRMTSLAAIPSFAKRSIDVLFVDGSHEYEDVKADIDGYFPLLSDDARLAFNDPSNPGVYRALKERVLQLGSACRNPRLVQNTLFFDFCRGARWTRAADAALRRLRLVLMMRAGAAIARPYMPMWLVRMGHAASRAMVGKQAAAPQ